MSIETTIAQISPLRDALEVDGQCSEEPGPPYTYARVTVFVATRDWRLSDLKAEAIEKAKEFLSRALSAPRS
jgi:hypothetical protein